MKAIHSLLTAGIALAMLTMSALALTLPVSEDSSTSGNASVAKSAGKGTTLAVSSARQGLIRFEAGAFADSISAGDVSKARLVIFISGVSAPGGLTLHRITQDWSEHGASVPAYDATPLATIPRSSVVAKQFVIIDVTAAVQAWLREPGTDFGFALAGSGGARVLLGSKEGAAAGHPAQLQIETGDAAGPFVSESDDAEDAMEGGRRRVSATAPIGNFVTNNDVVNNSLKGKKLKDASLLGKKLALETVTGANILDGSITTTELADGSVTTGKLADASVTAAKLAANSVGTGNLGDASITTAKLAANSVTSAKLDATIGLWTASGANVVRATGSVGIGTTNPAGAEGIDLNVASNTGQVQIVATAYANGTPQFTGQNVGGTLGAETPVQNGNVLAFFSGRGWTGTTGMSGSRGTMIMNASEAWSNTAQGAEIAFGTTLNGSNTRVERLRITNNGNVGIGTATPELGLEVVGPSTAQIAATAHQSTALFLGRSAGGTPAAQTAITSGTVMSFFGAQGHTGTGFSGIRAAVTMNASENFTATANGSEISFGTTQNGSTSRVERLRITNNGNVGIGTTNPTRAKVEIIGFVNAPLAAGQVLNASGAFPFPASTAGLSLFCDLDIAARQFIAPSDERIKRIEGHSDAARDLTTLLSIEVTDYSHIDTMMKGTGKQKKVIAQQLEKVYPQAVSRMTNVVPDIYQKAETKDGWVRLATNLKKGERVRLIGEKKEGIHEVLEVAEDQFRTDFAADGHEVFVYGREVKDFRAVDYDAIAMLNVSATQELHRKIEARDAEVAKLRAENATLANKLATIEARDQAREARLARIEGTLDAAPARVVRASLDRK